MKLSIIIVNWNGLDVLKGCLESVYEQTKNLDFEVIVVDNNSSDGSVAMVEELFPQVILIACDENNGFAKGNNIGSEAAKGEYLLYLNSDTIVLDGALNKCFDYIDSREDVDIFSCRMLNKDQSLQPNCSKYPSILNMIIFVTGLYRVFPKSTFFGRENMTWFDYKDEMEVEVICGCFMFIRRKCYESVGGMDERFFMYSEEVDWCYRFNRFGYRIHYWPGADIIHLGGASAVHLGSERAVIKDESTVKYMKKNWGPIRASLGYSLLIFFYLSRLPVVSILALLDKQGGRKKIIKNHIAGLKNLLSMKRGG